MKRIFAVLALTTLALTGCGGATQASSSTPTTAAVKASTAVETPSATPTPTPKPTPTVMSTKQAGAFYLSAICPTNGWTDKASQAMQAQPFDLAAAKRAMTGYRESLRKMIDNFEAKKALWPASVRPDVNSLVEYMYSDLGQVAAIADEKTAGAMIADWNAWVEPAAHATVAQKVRVKLGLSSDMMGSCNLT